MPSVLIVSDVHLSPVLPYSPWMPYRQGIHSQDAALASLIDAQRGEIVLNGDIFDFDAPNLDGWGYSPYIESECVEAIARILDDHPLVVNVLRRAIARGCRATFIAGNHDAPVVLSQVRKIVTSRLGSVNYATWFYQTQGIHIEHGHQYDPLCALESMLPEPTVGSIAAHYVPVLLSSTNPHASDPFSLRAKLLSIMGTSLLQGPVNVPNYTALMASMFREIALVSCPQRTPKDAFFRTVARETEYPVGALHRHASLWAPKANLEQFIASKGWDGYSSKVDAYLRRCMENIAELYSARAVVTGHTHKPFGHFKGNTFFGNSGAWVPNVGIEGGTYRPGTYVRYDGATIGTYSI
jgi:UDP-2,3-diacylglucosamine pyrophosphatase LpxH